MLQLLDKFSEFSKVDTELKNEIKLFHVFHRSQIKPLENLFSKLSKNFNVNLRGFKGNNVLFITSDDKVYGFGSNTYGCCGLGHNSVVNEPQPIPELSEKGIKQFIFGRTFVLALSNDHKVYGWGRNNWAQLGRGFDSGKEIILKPQTIDFKNENIIQVSSGSDHSLALTSGGKVFGWGANNYGQIGCGYESGGVISEPNRLKVLENISIKSIYCSYSQSFALTSEGKVYSWGRNNCCLLGHESDENVFEPRLINFPNVLSIRSSKYNTYFLTNEGFIYFCGEYKDESYQKALKLLNRETKFSSLYSFTNYQEDYAIVSAVSNDSIYHLNYNNISKTESKDIIEYYCKEWNVCHKTIQICNEFDYKESDFSLIQTSNERTNHFTNMFTLLKVLGKGSFGEVSKVEFKFDKKLYAIKKITIEFSEEEKGKIMREVNIQSKCSAEYVVQYFDSWIENNEKNENNEKIDFLYIQMELCSNNLKNIIKEKREYFGRKSDQEMNTIEYFISCQLFKEVLECVQYLHESNPKIMHRDLKPENILITENTNNQRFLKLCDFGLAKVIESTITRTNAHTNGQGSFGYMAPEILKNPSKYNEKVDIYSLGVIAQDLLDFDDNDTTRSIKNTFIMEKMANLIEFISKMTNRARKERPSCDIVLTHLKDWSINLNELEKTDFSYSDVFIEDSFFKKYFDSINQRI